MATKTPTQQPMKLMVSLEIRKTLNIYRNYYQQEKITLEELQEYYESVLPKSYHHGFKRFVDNGVSE